jgi:hypothetical protein
MWTFFTWTLIFLHNTALNCLKKSVNCHQVEPAHSHCARWESAFTSKGVHECLFSCLFILWNGVRLGATGLPTTSHGWYKQMRVGQLVEYELARETEARGGNLPQCHFVYHKSHMNWLRIKPWPSQSLSFSVPRDIFLNWDKWIWGTGHSAASLYKQEVVVELSILMQLFFLQLDVTMPCLCVGFSKPGTNTVLISACVMLVLHFTYSSAMKMEAKYVIWLSHRSTPPYTVRPTRG